ncbi:MAG TPA: EAL domain-containing protein [Actinomycetota bacterium]|nr:EAL domain-containing protein [Actinomycetota bacterium]
MDRPARAGPAERRLSGVARIWLLTAGIAAAAVLLYVGIVRSLPGTGLRPLLPWWALIPMFYVAEISVVHLRFRRDAHSFSMSEIPLVLGLFFAGPAALVPAQILGSVIALVVHRRQPLLKLAFNLSQFALQACVAAFVFHGIVALGDPLGPAGWAGAVLATQATLLLADGLINAAIALSGDRLPPQAAWGVLATGVAATAMNTSLALVGVTILAQDLGAAWLAAVPPVVLFIAYRAYSAKRREHERLESLYEATRALHASPQLEPAMSAAVQQARDLFDSQVAEIILFPRAQNDVAFSTRLGPGDDLAVMSPFEVDLPEPLRAELIDERRTVLIPRPVPAGWPREYLAARGLKDAVIAPLLDDGIPVGLIMVGDRMGDVSTFEVQDVKMLETLAQHVSVSLENGRLEDSLAELTALKEELRHRAFHDSLTGLPNRMLFTERVAHALTHRERHDAPMAVLFVDLDDFKTINDSLGHTAGDQVLSVVAERLRGCLRPSDTVARLGGDEFGILLDDMADTGDALLAAERILAALSQPAYMEGREVSIRASLGITLDAHGQTAETLLRNADLAMYMAKRRGKSRYQVFESSMHAEMVERLELTAHLTRAIDDREFVLEYQPIVNLETSAIEGVEALVRWRHPERGLLAPAEFIPLAEETGLIVPLGWAILEEACARAARWQGGQPLAVSVNLSPKQLTDPELVAGVRATLEDSGLDPSALILEITEDVLMHESEATMRTMRELKALGVRLAIDDFGTGYSSLSYLERFPVDMLKIAKTFVDGLDGGAERSTLVEAVIRLGEALGLRTVAEGIETAEQLDRLRGLHCEQGQGYLFARPLDEAGIEGFLRDPEPAALAAG